MDTSGLHKTAIYLRLCLDEVRRRRRVRNGPGGIAGPGTGHERAPCHQVEDTQAGHLSYRTNSTYLVVNSYSSNEERTGERNERPDGLPLCAGEYLPTFSNSNDDP